MAEPLLTKDAVNIGGHKFPIPLIGALAAVAGVALVLRARSQGAQVASIGTPPDLSGYSAGVAGQTDAAQLADLQLQLSSIESQLTGLGTPPASPSTAAAAAPTPASPPATPGISLVRPPGFVNPDVGVFYGPRGVGGVPLPRALIEQSLAATQHQLT